MVLAAMAFLSAAACGPSTSAASPVVGGAATVEANPPSSPGDRTVAVVTTGCGSASATIGSAVRLDRELVLTAAHVVAGSGAVRVLDAAELPPDRSWPEFSPASLFGAAAEASIVAFDAELDLALISTGDGQGDIVAARDAWPEFATVAADTAVDIHGITATDPVTASVAERTTIVADEVRGTGRVRRDGYRLEGRTARGDSGAGVWSADDRLVGLVFAVSPADDTRTWAVSGSEVQAFLEHAGGESVIVRCDPETSRVGVAERGS